MTRPKNAIIGATWAVIGYVLAALVILALIGLCGLITYAGWVR